jgi:hypothetical protein
VVALCRGLHDLLRCVSHVEITNMKRLTLGQAIDHVLKRIIQLDEVREPICYHASEAVYLLAGGKKAGLKAMYTHDAGDDYGTCHWFLSGRHGEIFDLTAGQFKRPPNYSEARGSSFYPNCANFTKLLMHPYGKKNKRGKTKNKS